MDCTRQGVRHWHCYSWTQKSLFICHLVSGKCQTWEYGAATWPGKKNKVLVQKGCSWVENVKVQRSREGSPLLLLSQWWPLECLAPGGVAACGGARFAVVAIK